MEDWKNKIPPEKLKDDDKYLFLNPNPESDADEKYPNSALEQIHFNMNHPKRLWLFTASIEKTCPAELDQLKFITERQRKIIQLRYENYSFAQIGNRFEISKQAVHACLERAKKRIENNFTEFRRVMNSSQEGVDVLNNSKGTFFLD